MDGRSTQELKAAACAGRIEHWLQSTSESGLNLAALQSWLMREHGHDGSLRSAQRFWKRTYPAPRIRARRRVETPPGAQIQVDWAHFPGVVIGNEAVDLLAIPARRLQATAIPFQATLQEGLETLESTQAEALYVVRDTLTRQPSIFGILSKQDIEASYRYRGN